MLKKIKEDIKVKIETAWSKLCYPSYFYGAINAYLVLSAEHEDDYDEHIFEKAYYNILTEQLTQNILNILPRHDKIKIEKFMNKIIDEYNRQIRLKEFLV